MGQTIASGVCLWRRHDRPRKTWSVPLRISIFLRPELHWEQMRLLSGPAGSGKTTYILDRFRKAVFRRNQALRLLVPTATMAQHLQNRLAREGFVFRCSLIQTLSGSSRWAGDCSRRPPRYLYLIVEEAARRVNRPEFARVAHMPGFCASLARVIGEFSSAGCDSARLAACLPDAPLSAAFLAVYREVDRELERAVSPCAHAAWNARPSGFRSEGLNGIRTIWLDGFHALPDPELRVIAALGRHAELTLTLDEAELTPACARARRHGFQRGARARGRARPRSALVKAPGIEREVEEIARRILQQADRGPPLPRDRHHRPRPGNLRSHPPLHPRALRHSRPLLFRCATWSATRSSAF